jgi:hypothetical protein
MKSAVMVVKRVKMRKRVKRERKTIEAGLCGRMVERRWRVV